MSRVALMGENSVEYISALLNIWNNGDCAVLLDWRIPFGTAVDMMREAGVTHCYSGRSCLDHLRTKQQYCGGAASGVVSKI